MNIKSKKLISLALVASTALWGAGIAMLPTAANAQTTSNIQAQIAALLQQIQQLQAQLGIGSSTGSTGTGTGTGTVSYTFTRSLTVGSRGADVSALQQFLIGKGYLAISAPTGYFGPLTKSAVGKFQAANGIVPAAGYFGPITRAFVNSLAIGNTGGGSTGGNTGGGTGGGTTTSTPPTATTGLTVGLASDNPTPGSLITSSGGGSGAARVPVLAVNLTAGTSGAIMVNEIKFHKTGVVSDSSIAGAYLTQNGKVIAQYNSVNQGVIDFANIGLQVPAGQTADIQLAIDIAGGLSAGNTAGFALTSASDISATNTSNNVVTPTGTFPLNGNTFTVTSVSSPSLATLSITGSSIGTTVTAGSQGNLVGAWNFTVGNSRIALKGINFRVIGSANKSDLRNVKLMINGTQVGQTLASVAQDGTAYFDLSSTPGVLNTGSNNVQLFANVVGSPSFNFQFEILNGYDVYAVDTQYNVPISTNSQTGTQVNIQQGQITVTQDASTPTGNVAKGQSQTTLAKFDVYAAGEAVRVKFLTFKLTFTGGTVSSSATLANAIKNIAITDDAGGQIGNTINTPPTSNSCDNAGTSVTAGIQSTDNYIDCFGTSASPINYIIPANTTRVLSLKADIQSGASFGTVTASLTGNSSNLQGVTSSQVNSSGGATGASRTLSSSSLTAAQNNALGSQGVAKGVTNQRIGSYSLSASTAEGVNISTVSIQANGSFFQNLKLLVNGTQFGTTQGTISSGSIYTFSGTPFTIPMGATTNVDVYADVLSSASGSLSPATSLTGCSGSGQTSFTSISCGSVTGQSLSIAGQSSFSVSADSSQAPSGQVVMGSTGNPLATFRFTETSNVENVKVTTLNVIDSVASTTTVKPAFTNLTLWNGSTQLGTAGTPATSVSGTAYIYTFNFGTPVVVPQANSVSLVLKGDVASYSSSGATDNSAHTFKIATTADSNNNTAALAVTALGATSNATTSVSLSNANGNTQTVLRSKLNFAATPVGATISRGKTASDQLTTLAFTANSAGSVAVNTVTVTFSGSAANSANFLSGVSLRDENNNSIGTISTSSACTGGTTTCSVTFNLGSGNAGQVVSAGTTRTWSLVIDDTKTQSVTGTNNVNLVATINATGDIQYTDGLDSSATTGLTLPSSILTPINLNSVVYAQGT